MEHLHFFEALERKFLYNTKKSMVYTVDDFSEEFIKLYLSGKSLEEIKTKFHDIDKEKLDKIYNFIKKADEKEFFSNEEIEVEISKEKEVEVDSITLMLTNRCNLCCTYCFEGEKVNKDMTKETVEKVIDYLVEKLLSEKIKSANISFFGGEPLLKFDLIKYAIAYIESKDMVEKFTFGITTNGTIANEEIYQFLEKYDFNVILSLDGPKEIHDMHRVYSNGKGSLEEAIKNYNKFFSKLNTYARATLFKDSLDYSYVNNFLEELGFTKNSLAPASTNDKRVDISNLDYDKINTFLDKHFLEFTNCFVEGEKAGNPCFLNLIYLIDPRRRSPMSCVAGNKTVTLDTDGTIYVCHRLVGEESFELGKIDDLAIFEIEKNKFVKSLLQYTGNECKNCFALNFCNGGCYHENYMKTGSIFKHNDEGHCKFRKKKAELCLAFYATVAEENPELFKEIPGLIEEEQNIRWFPLNNLLQRC